LQFSHIGHFSGFPKLIKYEIVIKTRDVGRAKLYKLNIENQIAKHLLELYDSIILNNLKKLKENLLEITA